MMRTQTEIENFIAQHRVATTPDGDALLNRNDAIYLLTRTGLKTGGAR